MLYSNQWRLIKYNAAVRLNVRYIGVQRLTFFNDVDTFESKYRDLLTENTSLSLAMCVIENNSFCEFLGALKCWVK